MSALSLKCCKNLGQSTLLRQFAADRKTAAKARPEKKGPPPIEQKRSIDIFSNPTIFGAFLQGKTRVSSFTKRKMHRCRAAAQEALHPFFSMEKNLHMQVSYPRSLLHYKAMLCIIRR